MGRRVWDGARDARLRELYPRVGAAGAAAELGCTVVAVRSRANVLGVACSDRRPWSAAEDAELRRLHPTHTAAAIAAALGRRPKSVGMRCRTLGLRKLPDRRPLLPRVAELHAQGLSDAAIGAALGVPRREAGRLRAGLGLAVHPGHVLEAKRRAVRTQAARLGVPPGGAIRAVRHRALAAKWGLPPECGPRHVQCVLALVKGPLTKKGLCRALGVPWRPESRRNLKSNGPGGSYPADLMRLGLVSARRVYRAEWRTGFESVYALTPKALGLLAAVAPGKDGAE